MTGDVTVGAAMLPRSAIIDAGFILGIRAEADADSPVWLRQLIKIGTLWSLAFTWAPDGENQAPYWFDFAFDATDPFGTTLFSDATGGGPDLPEHGTAFLTIGDITAASAELADGIYLQDTWGTSRVLPGLVQTLKNHFVRRVHLANDPGVQFLDCGEAPRAMPVTACPQVMVRKRNLSGDIRLRVGYNAQVAVAKSDNRLTLGGSVGAGLGVPCEEIDRGDEGSLSSAGGTAEAPTCEDLVYMINGIGPDENGYFQIVAGQGFTLDTEAGIIELTADTQAYCVNMGEEEEGSSV